MSLAETLIPIIKEAAKIMLSAHNVEESNAVTSKAGDANFVTVYDKATQDFLIKKITEAIPEATFVAEEQENDLSALEGEYAFIIDPIDGTTNFIHDFSHSSISVACASRGEVIFGAVYNPYLDEMFYAERGKGAYKNNKPISVSKREMKESVFSFGSSPYYKDELGEKGFALAYKIFKESADIRRLASAALDLCYVACGRLDSFFEFRLSPWDHAAGSLILTEAGGKISDMEEKPLSLTEPSSVIAANEKCYKRILEIVKEYQ